MPLLSSCRVVLPRVSSRTARWLALHLVTLFIRLDVVVADPRLVDTTTATSSEDDMMTDVVAVVGDLAVLPCSLTSGQTSDRAQLVLWYRDGSGRPFYSVDVRDGSLAEGVHWRSDSLMKGRRMNFTVNSSPSALLLYGVRTGDSGSYRCRVDFILSPTRNSHVNMSLIEPPEMPVIGLSDGRPVGSVLGPLSEGDNLQLTCKTRGGQPPPQLTWWQAGERIHTQTTESSGGIVRSRLTIAAISRQNSELPLECQASNNNISAPLTAAVQLQAYFKPLYARLSGRNRPMSLGRRYQVTCQTAGSRPPPEISWWLNGRELHDFTVRIGESGVTTSIVSLNVTKDYNQQHLICRVANLRIPNSKLEDSWRISVHYPPKAHLSLGKLIDPGALSEGDDVYFECHVKANPQIVKIDWLHNGKVLKPSSSGGVVFSNRSLALQKLTRHSAGEYACQVANSEGQMVSNLVHLSVLHAPVCRPNQRTSYTLTDRGVTQVSCLLDANPSQLTISWRMNSTEGMTPVDSTWYSDSGDARSASKLVVPAGFKLHSAAGDSQLELECSASNSAGQQLQPCSFTLMPAETEPSPPRPPRSCIIHNRTSTALHVRCFSWRGSVASSGPEEPGGQQDRRDASSIALLFHIEAYQAKTRLLLSNLTSSSPDFIVDRLQPGEELLVHLFATSGALKSELVTLEAVTLRLAELKTMQGEIISPLHLTSILGALLGATVAVLLVILVVLFTRRRSRIPRGQPPRRRLNSSLSGDAGLEESREKMLGAPLHHHNHHAGSTAVSDDHSAQAHTSPDVVPCKFSTLDSRFSSRKGFSDCYFSGRSSPFSGHSMLSISETVAISPDSGLPRRLPPPPRCPQHYTLPSGGLQSFCRPPKLEVPPSLMELPRFSLPPSARGSIVQLPPLPPGVGTSMDDGSQSEAGSERRSNADRSWSESIV